MSRPTIFETQIERRPDYYPWTETYIRAMWDNPWNDKKFSFASDKQDFFVKLSDQERQMIIRALSAISQIEVAVKTYWAKLGDNLPHPSLKDLGYVMANIEVIHNHAYERLIRELDIEEVFHKNLELEWMQGRVNYLNKHTHKYYKDSKQQFVYSLILFTLFVENVSLFSQFYVINWFGRKNLLKDTNQQTAYTAREEDLHAKAGISIIKAIKQEHPELFNSDLEKKILHETNEAVKSEDKIIEWVVNGKESDFLSSKLLKNFIRNRMNESLIEIGYKPIFEIDQKLIEKTTWFDEKVFGNCSTDFFHSKPTEYSKNDKVFDTEDLFD